MTSNSPTLRLPWFRKRMYRRFPTDLRPSRQAEVMAHMGAACVASAGAGLRPGSAAAMTMMPVVPDYSRFPTGRDLGDTRGEIGLAGHWVKLMLNHLFIYKAKGRPGWQLIPE